MEKSRAVIFDLDGTLLDTLGDLGDSVNRTLERFGFPTHTYDDIRLFVGDGAAKLIERAIPNGTDNEKYPECCAYFKAHYHNDSNNKTHPYDGILPLLELLEKNGIACAVVSNKPHDAAVFLCKKFFGDRIRTAVGERDGIRRKPYPDSLLCVMDELRCSDAIYVGDSDTDIMTAKNADVTCVSVSWGFRDREFLLGKGAEHIADSAEELLEKINEIFGTALGTLPVSEGEE